MISSFSFAESNMGFYQGYGAWEKTSRRLVIVFDAVSIFNEYTTHLETILIHHFERPRASESNKHITRGRA